MAQSLNEEQAFQKLAARCARGEHCQYDMLEKMRQWELDEQQQAAIMQRLVGEHYIDEERYTRAFVHDKLEYNQWGPMKIQQALRMKRVDPNIIRRVLEEIDDEVYLRVLEPLLRQKRKTVSGRNDYERDMKVTRWALSRGFSFEQITQASAHADD